MERIRQAFEKYISPQKIYFPTKMDSVSEMYANYYKYMLPYLIWLITNMYDTILVEKKKMITSLSFNRCTNRIKQTMTNFIC